MAENGVKISDNPTLASADYLLALNEGTSGLFTISDLGTLLAGGGVLVGTPTTDALSARITAVEDQAFAESPIYETTAEGIAATGEGDRFRVENADPAIAYDVYDHDAGGVATFLTDIPAGSALVTKPTISNALSEYAPQATTARGNIGAAAQTALTDAAGRINYLVANIGGTGNAATCNLADTAVGGAAVSLTRGMVLRDFPWPGTNTGAVTLNVGGTGAVAVQDGQGTALPAGALATSDRVSLVYTGAVWRLLGQGYRRIWDRRLRPQRLQSISTANPDAITATTADGTISQYTRGQFFFGRIGSGGNSGGPVTVNIAGLGALPLLEPDGSDPAAGRLAAATEFLFQYDGTDFILWAPSAGGSSSGSGATRPTVTEMIAEGETLGHFATPYALAGRDAFEPPAGLGWTATDTVYAALVGSTWLCSVNPRTLVAMAIWSGNVFYVDPEEGDDSNDGVGDYWGDYSSAKRNLHAAITAGNATGSAYIIKVKGGESPGETWATNNGAVEPTQHMAIICDAPMYYRVGSWTNTWTLDSGTCYYTTATSIGRVLRTDKRDARGHYIDLEHQQDNGETDAEALAAVRANPDNTFWRDLANNRVYVNIGREPGNRHIALLRNVRGLEFDSSTPGDIYIEGMHTEGGIDGAFAVTGTGTRNIVAVNCSFLYQGHRTQIRNAVSVTQTEGLVAMFGVDGSKGQKDGFGYHSDAGAGLSVLHVNCISADNGRLDETSINGFTTHDTVKSIDIGGRYGWGINGTEVHCIEQTLSWFLGTRATARDPDGTCGAFKCSEDAVMYLEETFADAAGGGTNNFAIEANGGTVLKRNHTNLAGTEEVSGAGSIGTF
ncbi:hypothetical protein SAMN04488105_10417 [Salipiger thiooxidans]|uniref:Uncharacterized protein n=1 Tax=Salipiger thiooxidans TaxID=282683 RepID=A0A1G7D579_9RHOB|nr:hypothetical protein [Salipiger thiooxidans]SDE46742.1 hypothetical protein SAMN04488105_10417 [Salipiger thiooxidans]